MAIKSRMGGGQGEHQLIMLNGSHTGRVGL